jgi:hypothetical protein
LSRAKFVTAVALYGIKKGPLKELLQATQEILRTHLGARFRPYTLDQIHSTLIRLDWRPDERTGRAVNTRYREVTGVADPMDPARAMELLGSFGASSHRIRIGGYAPGRPASFTSRGVHPHDRMFSVQGRAFVLVGWPLATIAAGTPAKPLDDLRRNMKDANILHWYHESPADIDNDFHLVVGHHDDALPHQAAGAVTAVRRYLAEHPAEVDVSIDDVAVIASDSSTLAPAEFIGRIPEDHAAIMELFR